MPHPRGWVAPHARECEPRHKAPGVRRRVDPAATRWLIALRLSLADLGASDAAGELIPTWLHQPPAGHQPHPTWLRLPPDDAAVRLLSDLPEHVQTLSDVLCARLRVAPTGDIPDDPAPTVGPEAAPTWSGRGTLGESDADFEDRWARALRPLLGPVGVLGGTTLGQPHPEWLSFPPEVAAGMLMQGLPLDDNTHCRGMFLARLRRPPQSPRPFVT